MIVRFGGLFCGLAMFAAIGLCISLVSTSCGNKSDRAKKDAATGPSVAPLTVPTVGVEQVKQLSFGFGDGPCEKAYRAKPRDWGAIRAGCEPAVAKDPSYLEARRHLAIALAQTNEGAAAVDHLTTILALDFFAYEDLLTSAELAPFFATPHGQAVTGVAAKLRDAYMKRIPAGIWLVARRATYKPPANPGVQSATSRGEVYAYDRETKRFLRLTHTDHKVVGFVRSGSAAELAVLGFDKIDRPKDDGPPTLVSVWLQVFGTADWKPIGNRIALPASREVAFGYGAGDQLLVSTAQANGRWGLGFATIWSADKTNGKLTKVSAALPAARVSVTLDETRVMRSVEGVEAAWVGDPATAPNIKVAGGATIQIPESGAASQSSVAVGPGSSRVAFATAVDPCAKDTAPSLYVADTKTGRLRHVLTAPSRFATRWIDATTLAYEDGSGAIRLWDPSASRETARIDNRSGIALDVLSVQPGPLCKQALLPVDPAAAGSGDELPPEDSSGGPVTTP